MKGLVQILTEIGDDNLRFQVLSRVVTSASRTRANKPGKVTFGTEASSVDGLLDGTREALIVWVDRARLQSVCSESAPREACGDCPYEEGCDAYCAKRDGEQG
jgi:hypothetical protein